jgi:hypothetical protein
MKRAHFLRKMRDSFGWAELSELQIKNGFTAILKQYQEIREKLNSSGFGVDPEVDATLDKGIGSAHYFSNLFLKNL